MEKTGIGAICGVIGAAIGSVVTYFVTKNKVENTIKNELTATFMEAQRQLNEYYETNFEPKREPVKDSILMQNAYKKASEKKESEALNMEKLALETRENEDKLRGPKDENPVNYHDFYNVSEEEKVPSDGSKYAFYEEYGGVIDDKYPRIIPRSEFESANGYNKLKLVYYEESAVFAHAGDSSDSGFTEEFFGLQNLSEFGNYKYDDGVTDSYTLFFRSDETETDFEVWYDPNDTYEEVLAKEGKLVND